MRETVLALGLFALLAGGSWAFRMASPLDLVWTGAFLVGGGLLFSLPCAVRYHLLLHRALAPRRALDTRWLWHPTGHHARLTEEERARVMPWFYAGAAGWGASMLGCLLLGAAALALD